MTPSQNCTVFRADQSGAALKIIYHHRIGSKDGQAVHLEELIQALRALGHDVTVVGPGQFGQSEFGHEPGWIALAKRSVPKAFYEVAELGYNLVAALRLAGAYRSISPDFIYERCNLYSLAGTLLRKLVRAPLLLEVNAPLARERAAFGGLAFPTLAGRLEAWTWRNADVVFPVSDVLAGEVREKGVAPDRIVVIPNAINADTFLKSVDPSEAKRRLGLAGKIIVGFTGFARDWHGLDALIDLLAREDAPPNLRVMIAGEGPALAGLKTKAAQLGVSDRVLFAGLVSRDEIPDYTAAFDVAVVPKCVPYCSPLKLFEYMALGKAILAPDQPNIREVLVPDFSALLFAPDDRQALTAALLRLAADEKLRQRLGDNARAAIMNGNYTWHGNAVRVSEIARDAMRRVGTRPPVSA